VHDTVTTFLFTDIEGSTRLWEQDPQRMRPALACHDLIVRGAVEEHRGRVVKMTGDGLHAAFAEPLDAINAMLEFQKALADPERTHGVPLRVRCGLHAGISEGRDGDYYGSAVNRAARIMSAAHGGQMLLSQAVAGRIAGGLPDGVRMLDLGAVRLRDMAAPEHIFQVVHPALRGEFPALRSLERTPNNLPHQVTAFVGRERELSEVRALLAKHRLVSLIGMGGIGKTRLSLHVAAELLEQFPDGIWLVELAPLNDPRLVAQAVASVLGVKQEAGCSVADALAREVGDRRLLLILDNCEHLGGACAELAKRLLTAGAQLRILASSREPLQIGGEITYLLSPLATPDLRASFDPVSLVQFDAVRLFVALAAAAVPGFALTTASSTEVAAICHRLEGIPLALELAAARLRTVSPRQIAERLDDRFRILTKADPTVLPRQQTLRATMDWSHDLLAENERVLFRDLAVFAGGWTMEAAEAILAPASPDTDVVDLLGQLVEKSLVLLDRESGRYRFLETVRQYAQEKLELSGDAGPARQRHFGHFLELAKRAKPELIGRDQAAWLALVDGELENILAAHAYAQQTNGLADEGITLSNAMKMYWLDRGLIELGHRVAVEALARPGASDLARCRGLFDSGQLSYVCGNYGEARRQLDESLAIARRLGNQRSIAAILQPLGMAAFAQGEPAIARACLEEALAMARQRDDPRELAAALNALGQLLLIEGRNAGAAGLFSQALQIAADLGDRESIAVALLNVAMVSLEPESVAACRRQVAEALAIAEELRSSRLAQSVLEVCAGLASAGGDWMHCALFVGAAEERARKTGLRRDPADEAFLAPHVEIARRGFGAEAFAAQEAAGRLLAAGAATELARSWLRGT